MRLTSVKALAQAKISETGSDTFMRQGVRLNGLKNDPGVSRESQGTLTGLGNFSPAGNGQNKATKNTAGGCEFDPDATEWII